MNLNIKEGVTKIDAREFRDKNLTFLQLPSTLEEIEEHAFETNKIDYVILPDNLKFIGGHSFDKNVILIHKGKVVRMIKGVPKILEDIEWMNEYIVIYKVRNFNNPKIHFLSETALGTFISETKEDALNNIVNNEII